MIGAAKRKSSLLPGLAALRLVLLLIVTLCLGETRVWGFAITPQPTSGVFESVTPSCIGQNTTAIGYDPSDSLLAARGVVTPQGTALQALTPEALALRNSVAEGQSIFRAGNFPRSAAAEGQYWSTQSPLSSGYANSVGAANLGASTPEFIMGGSVRPGANFITRPAPPYGGNAGGGLEIVTDPNALRLDFFHMP